MNARKLARLAINTDNPYKRPHHLSPKKHDFERLYQYLPVLFPNADAVERLVNTLKYRDYAKYEEIFTNEYLPFHTRDEEWLLTYAVSVITDDPQMTPMHFKHIDQYVAHSKNFAQARDTYEQDLMHAQMAYLAQKPIPNGLTRNLPYRLESVDIDEDFRRDFIDAFHRYGIPRHNIEVALETGAARWRPQLMQRTFESQYYPHDALLAPDQDTSPWHKKLANLKPKHQAAWLKHREYAYYQEHKDIIDEVGTATPIMKLKPNSEAAYQLLNKKLLYDQAYREIMDQIQQTAPEHEVTR